MELETRSRRLQITGEDAYNDQAAFPSAAVVPDKAAEAAARLGVKQSDIIAVNGGEAHGSVVWEDKGSFQGTGY